MAERLIHALTNYLLEEIFNGGVESFIDTNMKENAIKIKDKVLV